MILGDPSIDHLQSEFVLPGDPVSDSNIDPSIDHLQFEFVLPGDPGSDSNIDPCQFVYFAR